MSVPIQVLRDDGSQELEFLHCTKQPAPYLLSVSRLITVLDEADECSVVCKLQEHERGVFRGEVVGVQGEEQWGENTALRNTSVGGAAV